ncbi:MAG TPA: sigma-54 dependent transcriptional regulator [candidate division Zixibacteria bacterium]|nr:sigma-54 dependent transcriptional regulator [candidate division Zixibacteria bacterium]
MNQQRESWRILLADDDDALRRVLHYKLSHAGYVVTPAVDGRQALDLLRRDPFDLLLTDMKMPGLSGLELLERARELKPQLKVIMITAFATVSQAVQAVKLGAFDYLTKPFEDDQLFVAIEKALKFHRLEAENSALKGQLRGQEFARTIVGAAPAFRDALALVDKIAPTDATALITGESGVGKEIFARAIHLKSQRANGPFVAVNCAAIPAELIESELFGHVKGAFTGAIKDKKGKFALADGGTLLLDEVGDLPAPLQVKLLRVIQERTIEPVGAEQSREIDVRLIAATHQDLTAQVRSGDFREDLYYRLNVIPLRVPALRERREDIPLLARAFTERFANGERITLSADLLQRLSDHSWPGNVRELENLVERMVVLRSGGSLTAADLPTDFSAERTAGQAPPAAEPQSLEEAERNAIVGALNRTGWNRSRAAVELRIPRHVLLYRMKKYDIEPPPRRGA